MLNSYSNAAWAFPLGPIIYFTHFQSHQVDPYYHTYICSWIKGHYKSFLAQRKVCQSPFKIFLKFKWFFWFNFYFCIATEVSTNKETTLVFNMILIFQSLYQHCFMESHFLLPISQALHFFKKPPSHRESSTEHQSWGQARIYGTGK